MNYFQRLVRRALARRETTGPVLEDPFAGIAPWPLDPVSAVPAPQILAPAPSTARKAGNDATEQAGPTPLAASPSRHLPSASLPHGLGDTNAPETPPSNPLSEAPSERPHPAPWSMPAPPSIAESLRPAAPETTMTADPLLGTADAFMAQFEGVRMGIPTQSPSLSPVGEVPAERPDQWPAPTAQELPPLQPTPPTRATWPPATEQHTRATAPKTTPVSNTAPESPGSPAQVTVDPAPVQVVVVAPQSVHGPASRLGSGAPHLGLGQL